jgi:hypothetical protein
LVESCGAKKSFRTPPIPEEVDCGTATSHLYCNTIYTCLTCLRPGLEEWTSESKSWPWASWCWDLHVTLSLSQEVSATIRKRASQCNTNITDYTLGAHEMTFDMKMFATEAS